MIAITATHCAKIEELGSRFFSKSGTATVKGMVSNLSGTGLIISVNGQLQAVSSANVNFATAIKNGEAYTLAVAVQPSLPSQVCAFTSPTTGVASDGAILFALQCNAPPAWAIQGTTAGYAGSGLQVQLNGGEIVTVTGSSFSFATNISDTEPYNVQVKTQPTGPAQICTAQRNVGVVTGSNVTDISINCSTVTFSVGGFVTGLASGAAVTAQVNGTQSTARAVDGFFTFTNKLADQTAFDITVFAQPTGQICSVSKGTGIVDGPGSYAALIQCSSTTHTVSGTLSGLSGGYTTLVSSAGEFLPVTGNGTFSFTKSFALNSDYVIEVFRNPAAPAQTCTVANGTGTITANVTNVAVSCATTGYSIGGTSTISGLTSAGLILRLNGSSDIAVPANSTSFSFNESIAAGSSYVVTIAVQPTGQKCTLSNASGTAGATVTNVTVNCVNGYTVGGTVTGYTGSNLVLRNTINGTPLDLVISSNTAFTFPDLLIAGETYSVAVANFPETPYQNCTIANAAGTIAAANITNVNITCTNVTLAFTTVSSTPTEAAGAHSIALSLVGTTPRAGSVQVTITGGSATDTLDYTFATMTISWAALATPGNVVANIIDDAFNEGNETLQISLSNPVGITLGAQTTHTVTITDNDAASAVGAVIASAEYYDADRNGKIDYVKITFDKAVKDSSQVGWVNTTTNIGVSSQWLIAGYSGVQFVPQVCIDRSVPANGNCTDGGDITDVVDNAVIWLKFTEGSTYDTGATPDLTGVDVTLKTVATSPNDCYVYTSGATCQTVTSADFATAAVAEADKAEPILVAAWSDPIIDAWQLRLQFSEAADTTNNAACGTAIVNTDFTYNNTSGAGASSLRTDFADSNGCDLTSGNYYMIPRVDSRFVYGDLNSDTVTIAAAKFYDTLGNASIATTKTITYDPNLELYYPMDAAVGDTNSTVKDVSGKGRDGAASNVSLVKDMGENAGQAYKFGGAATNEIIQTGYKGILGNSDRTYCSWIKLPGAGSLGFWIFRQPDQGAVAGDGWTMLVNGSGTLSVNVDAAAMNVFAGPIYDGGWHHVCSSYSQADGATNAAIKLYIDGNLKTGTPSGSATISTNTISIDMKLGYSTAKATLDEARIYSRALTATEIKKLAVKVPTGLAAQYPLDDNITSGSVVDNSGNGNDALINGNPLPGPNRFGRATASYVFDGTGDLLRNTAANSLSGAALPRTICAWFKRTDMTGSVIFADTGASTATVGNMYRIAGLAAGQAKSDFYTTANSDSTSLYSLNNWSHVCGVYNGSTNTVYLNGEAGPSVANTATASATAISLGGTMDFTNILIGALDDVQVYNRALTAGEVKALATELDRGLVAYYPLDETTSATVTDYSGSGFTLNGSGAAGAQNTPQSTSDRFGISLSAMNFDGTDDMLSGSAASILPSGSATRTGCAWGLTTVDPGNGNAQGLMGYGTNSANQTFGIYPFHSTTDTFMLGTYTSSSTFFYALLPGSGWPMNQWAHYCIIVTGATAVEYYMNGIKINQSGTFGSPSVNTVLSLFRIGTSISGASRFTGKIDDVRVYNRALALAEIRELSGFSPGQLDDNTLWLDAGRGAFNNAGTTLATNTQSVQQWNDVSVTNGTSNAKNVSQTTSGQRPTWQANVINGQPALRFDGVDDQLELASLLGSDMFAADEANFFVVQKQSAAKDLNATFYWSVSASNRVVLHLSQSDSLVFDFPSTGGTGRFTVVQPTGWDDAFHITEAFRATTQAVELKVDNTLIGSGTRSATLGTGSTTTLYIGASSGGSYNFQGDIAEILVFKRGLAATERDKVTCYLSKKYAIAVSATCD